MNLNHSFILLISFCLSSCCLIDQVEGPRASTQFFTLNEQFISNFTVEESRLPKAINALPSVKKAIESTLRNYQDRTQKLQTETDFLNASESFGTELWNSSKADMRDKKSFDDRPLYWTRLAINDYLRHSKFNFTHQSNFRNQVIQRFELASRGVGEELVSNQSKMNRKVFITGFDPFLLDRNISQSNPSGVAAMMLDNHLLNIEGEEFRIQAVMIPVRYADFDKGMIEKLMTPYLEDSAVKLITTISMGREHFDLERFPGKRRSASAPDNENIYTGATNQKPLIPMIGNKMLDGPEFVEFSLPVARMMRSVGKFKVNDNRKVTTLAKTFFPKHLHQLADSTAVSGSGGGYLSNEISYRSIRQMQRLGIEKPIGHIHTPRITTFEPKTVEQIVIQIEDMLKLALSKNQTE